MSLEGDDKLDKAKEQNEKVSTIEGVSLLNSVELSDLAKNLMNLEQEIEESKTNFDGIAGVCLAKPICENFEISDG